MNTIDLFQDVKDFNTKFGVIPEKDHPHLLNEELFKLKAKHVQEELDEFIEAHNNNDIVGTADALIDIVYVALGAAFLMNIPFLDIWFEVHHRNMQKVRAICSEDSKRGSSYDIVKPGGWEPPAVEFCLFVDHCKGDEEKIYSIEYCTGKCLSCKHLPNRIKENI